MRKGKKIVSRISYRELLRQSFTPAAPLTDKETEAVTSFFNMLRENLYRPSPFARMRENGIARAIEAVLVPHFDSSWRPLAARRLWRSNG